jgi:peptide deformylase
MKLVDGDDPILASPASPVTLSGAEVSILASALQTELSELRTAVALSAPQVGVDARVFVTRALVAVNPTWEPAPDAKQIPMHEACLSLPERVFIVPRWTAVVLEATDERGNAYVRRCKGLLAQIVQHECDHLDGKLLTVTGTEVDG